METKTKNELDDSINQEPGELSSEESDDEESRTLFVGNLAPEVTAEIMHELFLQAGPIDEISIPTDRETKRQKNFGFVLYRHKCAVEYACNIFRGTRLFGRDLKLRNRKGGEANGNVQQGLERLSGYNRGSMGGQNADMMPLTSSPIAGGSSTNINPLMFMAMGEQMIQNLKMNNPFADGLGAYPSSNGRDSGFKDRGGNWNNRNMKPYERGGGGGGGGRGNNNNNGNNNNQRGWNDRRERSRSREKRQRSRSRERFVNNSNNNNSNNKRRRR